VQNSWTYQQPLYVTTTGTNITAYSGFVGQQAIGQYLSPAEPPPPKRETALEWLDRRVEEIRVRL
jgi:hypothetical protein